MRTAWLYAIATLVSALGSIAPAAAQTVYTDRAAFIAATNNQTVTNFNDLGASGTFFSATYTGTNFTLSSDAAFVNRDPADGSASYNFNSGDVLSLNRSSGERFATFTPGASVSAFGFDYSFREGFQSSNNTVAINGVDYAVTGRPTFNFFGIVQSGGNIAPISVNLRNGEGVFDNVRVASAPASAAPEPATWALMLIGFGVIGWALRRRHRPQVALRLA